MYQVVLDGEILVQKLRTVGVVGLDAAYLGSRNKDVVRRVCRQVSVHCCLVHQVKLPAQRRKYPGITPDLQAAHQSRAHHAARPGHQDRCVFRYSALGRPVYAHSWWSKV